MKGFIFTEILAQDVIPNVTDLTIRYYTHTASTGPDPILYVMRYFIALLRQGFVRNGNESSNIS